MRLEEEYRQRVERLESLRDLAEQQNDRNRAAELDELHDRLRITHAERMAALKARMDGNAALAPGAPGDERDAWLRRHQERAEALRKENRQHRDSRAHRDDRRAHRTPEPDLAETRERRTDRREMHREHRADHREARRDHAADHRTTRREHRREHGREMRGHARDRAEQHWLNARADAGQRSGSARHMNHAASRLAEKRWREEARDGSDERWERAARRSGMLDGVRPSARRERGSRMSQDEADREFERLWREIEAR